MKKNHPSIIACANHLCLMQKNGWEYCQRIKGQGAVVIAATTTKKELILIEQYRAPLGNYVLELPAGIIGDNDPNEDLLTAAYRELLEETGYEAHNYRELVSGPSSAGMSTEIYTLIHADKAKKTREPNLDIDENIINHLIPLDEALNFIKEQRQKPLWIDPKIYVALFFLLAAS